MDNKRQVRAMRWSLNAGVDPGFWLVGDAEPGVLLIEVPR